METVKICSLLHDMQKILVWMGPYFFFSMLYVIFEIANPNQQALVRISVLWGTWCSWLSRSLSMIMYLREVLGSIPNVSILFLQHD